MSERKLKTKRSLSNSPSISSTCIGLFECFDFISPNEYSEKTRGLCASLLRKHVGDINFSDVFGEIFEYIQSKQAYDLVAILEAKRNSLHANGASIEKCLMLNRWITYISEAPGYFMQLIDAIYIEMKRQIIDNQQNQIINYPEDFRQREKYFHQRIDAQNMRRLFYYSPNESKAPSIIHLQNQTTAHLNYIINSKMRFDRHFRDTGLEELEKIFATSFMVLDQPHYGVNPVLIAERKGPGIHVAKVSVIIISLLHDFMQTHPNMIELNDIEITLCPTVSPYILDEPKKLSWKTCELQINSNDQPRIVQYVELTSITTRQISSSDTQIHFAETLHSFTFLIKFRLNINEHKISTIYQISLQSLPFGIVTYNAHIPYSLTKVILDDIQRFAQHQSIDVKIISDFVRRYFMHRTGVEPKPDLQVYLKQELIKAKDEKKNGQSLKEIYADFLEQFINQIEFMAKHPILVMFYTEGLFLGPCDSNKSVDVMKRSTDINSPIVGLRFNTIKTDSKPDGTTANSTRTMKASTCFIRVDIYNPRTNNFQNRTFDSANLMVDIMKFVSTARETTANSIKILSNFDDIDNVKSYDFFTKYYHERLQDFHKEDPKYKPIIDLLYHVDEVDDNNHHHHLNGSNLSLNNLQMNSPPSTTTVNHVNGHMPVLTAGSMAKNGYPTFNQQLHPALNDEVVAKYVLSRPDLCIKILRQFHQMRLSAQQQIPLSTQAQHSPPMQYPTSFSMPNQSTMENSNQYAPIFGENSIQASSQQLSRQSQHVSMSTNSLRSDRVNSESTNEENYQWVDDFFSS